MQFTRNVNTQVSNSIICDINPSSTYKKTSVNFLGTITITSCLTDCHEMLNGSVIPSVYPVIVYAAVMMKRAGFHFCAPNFCLVPNPNLDTIP